MLGPLLFNIFINDIFLFVESSSIRNYVDDNTLFAFGKTFDEVTSKLKGYLRYKTILCHEVALDV